MREMGGLGKQMPLVRTVMIVGALALAGIPILNGFWSKELVLEAGHEGGPMWAWSVMLLGAGLTALYTLRFLTMVFFGEPRGQKHAHDAGARHEDRARPARARHAHHVAAGRRLRPLPRHRRCRKATRSSRRRAC